MSQLEVLTPNEVWGLQHAPLAKVSALWWGIEDYYGAKGKRDLCRADRFYLLTQVLHRPDAFKPWLYDRCREVEANKDGYLDLWAREHYKSTIITFTGSIQEILIDPSITIGIFSHTAPDAKKFVTQIKGELEGNAELKGLFPDVLYDKPDYQSPMWSVEKGLVVKRESNSREATIEGHGVVESQPVGSHFRLMIFDDLVTKNAVGTPEQVAKTTMMHSLADNLGARGDDGLKRKWHIGTRYHFRDTYQDLMDRKSVVPRIYAATDNGLRDGNPVFLSKEAWEVTKRDQISSVLAAQMLQNPAAGNEAMFQGPWLRFSEIRPATLAVAIMVDPASSIKRTSDSTVIHVWGIDTAWNRYLLDGYHHRMTLSQRWTALRDLRRKWVAEPGIQTVKVGYERYGAMSDLEYFADKMEQERYFFPIEELNWPRSGEERSKIDRIQRLEPDMRNGKIILPKLHLLEDGSVTTALTAAQEKLRLESRAFQIFTPTVRADENKQIYRLSRRLIDEILVYPYAPHDDGLDCASRWYDMDMSPPVLIDERSLEPEVFSDGA